ncbi:hypothetical protein EJB05_01732, partial [Eragrostis curvula]
MGVAPSYIISTTLTNCSTKCLSFVYRHSSESTGIPVNAPSAVRYISNHAVRCPLPELHTVKSVALGACQHGQKLCCSRKCPTGTGCCQLWRTNAQLSAIPNKNKLHHTTRACHGGAAIQLAVRIHGRTKPQVRRERISDRMRYLQELVPRCSKVPGKVGYCRL